MKIAGLQKLTLLDYPGIVACTVFTYGCNFRCPFCQNASLVLPQKAPECISQEEVLDFLKKRIGLLEGVAITGGEPLLHTDLPEFLSSIKEMGYRVKLDTNGSQPISLLSVIKAGLVDRVAMDIKSSPAGYAAAIGTDRIPLEHIEHSMKVLMDGDLPFEFRTTVVKGLHTTEILTELAQWIAGDEEYYLQQYRDSGDLIAPEGLSAFSEKELGDMLDQIRRYVPRTEIRGL